MLNWKYNANKTKHLLVENEFKKLKTFDSIYFRGKSHFEEDGTQNYLVFQPMYQYFKRVVGVGTGNYIYFWISKGLSDNIITAPTSSDYSLNPQLSYLGTKARLEFRGRWDKTTFHHRKVVNISIIYELDKIYVKTNPMLVNCLFGAVSLTKNADIDKYKYSSYGIGFDRDNVYSVGYRFGRNVIIFEVDMSLSVHVDNMGKDILILGKGPAKGLGRHSLTAEKMYSVNFTDHKEKYCLSLHHNGANSYLLMVQKLLNLKQKILRL